MVGTVFRPNQTINQYGSNYNQIYKVSVGFIEISDQVILVYDSNYN